ncbi:transposase [Streptomyces decoyicus]
MLVAGLVVPLNDAHWARIKPLLPDPAPRRGGRWRYHRQVIDAIAWRFTTGAPDAVPPRIRGPRPRSPSATLTTSRSTPAPRLRSTRTPPWCSSRRRTVPMGCRTSATAWSWAPKAR